jgi:hypothetical protein
VEVPGIEPVTSRLVVRHADPLINEDAIKIKIREGETKVKLIHNDQIP